jgi:transcriptional regulator with XRE-family HTH domain
MSFIGKNIRKIRAVKKLSQADFASIFNLARPSVGAYEEGRAEPKIDTVIQMAHHFGISIDLLLTKEITINELYHIDKYVSGPITSAEEQGKVPAKSGKINNGTSFIAENKLYEYMSGLDNKDFIADLPTMQLPQEKNRVNRAFEVNSNEMFYLQSGIKTGDIINTILVGKEQSNLKAGCIYFVISAGRFFFRRLGEINKVLVFVADNPDFGELRIGLDEIEELWEVKGVYRANLEKLNSVESKIIELDKLVQDLITRIKKLENQ